MTDSTCTVLCVFHNPGVFSHTLVSFHTHAHFVNTVQKNPSVLWVFIEIAFTILCVLQFFIENEASGNEKYRAGTEAEAEAGGSISILVV